MSGSTLPVRPGFVVTGLDVSLRNGSIKLHFPDIEPWELEETCALDVADRGGETLERVGELANVTRERIRQLEIVSLAKLQARREMYELRDAYYGPTTAEGSGKRRLPLAPSGDDASDDLDDE